MSLALIISIVAVISSATTGYFLYKLFDKFNSLAQDVGNQFSERDLDSKLESMFHDGSTTRTVDELTKMVFDNIKSRFSLEAKSYSAVIDEIKMSAKMATPLKELLIDFFNEIVRISYRAESISDNEQENLKNKIKLILRTVETN